MTTICSRFVKYSKSQIGESLTEDLQIFQFHRLLLSWEIVCLRKAAKNNSTLIDSFMLKDRFSMAQIGYETK